MQGVTDVVNGKMTGTLTQTTGADIARIAESLLDILGLDSRQIDIMGNRLISDARSRAQTARGRTSRFWTAEAAKWTAVKSAGQSLLRQRIADAEEEAAIAAANAGKETAGV